MTITADLDKAIGEAQAAGKHPSRMRLRMGPAALRALAADLKRGEDPARYGLIKIEGVEAPSGGGTEPSGDRFLGWELIAG